jgi:hypothetical protein
MRLSVLLLVLGLASSAVLPIAAAIPLASTLWDLQARSGQVNCVVTSNGNQVISFGAAQIENTSVVNVTLVTFYPKLVQDGFRFLMNLTWVIFLSKNITSFQFVNFMVEFETERGSVDGFGTTDLNIQYYANPRIHENGIIGNTTIIQNVTVLVTQNGPLSYSYGEGIFSYVGTLNMTPWVGLDSAYITLSNGSEHLFASWFHLQSYPTTVYLLTVPAATSLVCYGAVFLAIMTVTLFVYSRRRRQRQAGNMRRSRRTQ